MNSRYVVTFFCWLVPLLVVVVTGCGGQRTASVSGTVTYQNKPLEQGTISFIPAQGRPASGKIVKGQIVEVATMKANDGVVVGKHKVVIRSVSNPDDMYAEHVPLVPLNYSDPERSGLNAEIKPGSNVLKFDLQ